MRPSQSPFLWRLRNRTIHKAPLTHSLLNFTFGGFYNFWKRKPSSSNVTLKSLLYRWLFYQNFLFHASPFLFLKMAYVELIVGNKMRRHTCTKYFAKSKIGSKANNSYNHDREVHVYGMGYVEINDDNSKYDFYLLNFLDMASFPFYFLTCEPSCALFFGRASLACHLFSLPRCGSCFFGMSSFLSLFFSRAISFCMNV